MLVHLIFIILGIVPWRDPRTLLPFESFESSLSMIHADPQQENASKIRLDPELSV